MENAYGIGVKNRYELFYDEDVDPLEIIRQQEEEKERRKTDKAKDKNKSTKAAKQASSSVPKKAKENAPTAVSKPTEVIEPPSKPRNRAFGEKNKNTSSFDDTKDNEERKNFRNREDQYFNPDSSGTFTVRNSAYKRGNQESRDNNRPDGEFRRGRGGFRGRGRGRGRGGFSNFEGRPRREFDRHSGSDKTGVRSTDKRDGGGANNWGDMKDEIKYTEKDTSSSWDENRDEFEQTIEKKDTSGNDAWGDITEDFDAQTNAQTEPGEKSGEETTNENVESKENEPAVDADAIEEAVREMTLDEWKREQESKRSVPKYNLRKPGEGEDSSQWKKLYVLKKKVKDDDDDEEEEEDEDVSDEEYGRRGRHRQVVDIPINFSDSRRSRGRGRGGRGAGPRGGGGGGGGGVGGGGERGGGSGGGERGERGFPSGGPGSRDRGMTRGAPKIKPTQQSAPKVDDWNDFPSLVTA